MSTAWQHHEGARSAALEARSPSLLAHAMVQQALVLIEVGEVTGAVELVREAQGDARGHVPPLLSAWLAASEGEVLAAAGDAGGSRRAFDVATAALPVACGEPDLPYIQLDSTHLARWHGNVLARLGDGAATERLVTALEAGDQSLRARAALHTDLAYALTTSGDHRQAALQLKMAADFAAQSGSVRQRRRIRRLASERQ